MSHVCGLCAEPLRSLRFDPASGDDETAAAAPAAASTTLPLAGPESPSKADIDGLTSTPMRLLLLMVLLLDWAALDDAAGGKTFTVVP